MPDLDQHDWGPTFTDIIQDALSKADRVECPIEIYRQALNDWITEIRTALQASGGDNA